MPAKDVIHDAVKNALIKDGWTITSDPFRLKYKKVRLLIDLAAERPFAAEKDNRKIVVEIKSFLSDSPINDLKVALGQFNLYSSYLRVVAQEHELWLAISEDAHQKLFAIDGIEVVFEQNRIPLIIVQTEKEEIVSWIS